MRRRGDQSRRERIAVCVVVVGQHSRSSGAQCCVHGRHVIIRLRDRSTVGDCERDSGVGCGAAVAGPIHEAVITDVVRSRRVNETAIGI